MVSAGAANKKAFGIDRTTNPWSDMLGTEVIWVAGSNVAECSPITTNYIWQAREQGAKIIVQDPRITPLARTCDLFLPVKPGRDAALFAGVLQLMIEHDWLDHEFIDAHTVGFEQVAEYCREWTLAQTAEVTGVPQRAHRAGRRVVGHGEDQLPVPRARHRAPLQRRAERARHDQPRAGVRPDRQAEERLRHDRRPGQRPGRPRARTEMRPAARLARHQQPRAPRATSPASGASTRRSCPGPGVDAYEMFRKIDAARSRACSSICFNPKVSLPDNAVRHALPREARVLRRDRLLPERHRPARRHRAARLPARGGRGHRHAGRGPRHQDQQGGRLPRRACKRVRSATRIAASR